MDAGLIKRFDYWEMRVEPAATHASGIGASESFIGESHYRSALDDYASGIKIESELSDAGWENRAYIDGVKVWEQFPDSGSGNMRARLYGTLYAFGDYWYLKDCVVKFYFDGALVYTGTLGDLDSSSVGKQPSARPLIGIQPFFYTTSDIPVIIKQPDGTDKSASGSTTVGWRWMVDGAEESFDVALISGSPPGCGLTAPTRGVVSGSNTWAMNLTGGLHLTETGDDLYFDSWGSGVLPVPDVLRRWRRYGDDFREMVIRGGLPDLTQWNYSHCTTNPFGGSVSHDDADEYVERSPMRAYLLSVVGQAAHPFEDALNDTAWSLSYERGTLLHNHYYGAVLHDEYTRGDSVELTGASAAPSGAFSHLDAPGREVTRYWDFLMNVHWSHGAWFEDWPVDGSAADLNDYWELIRQQHLYNPALP